MTVVIRTHRKSRLSRMVDKAGGLSVRTALQQARRNLAALKPRSQEIAAELVARLAALPAPATGDDMVACKEEAYALASGVIDAAGLFEMCGLCAAAASLCDIIDSADGHLDWRIVSVHARAMELMLAEPNEAQSQRILEGLADIRARKGRI